VLTRVVEFIGCATQWETEIGLWISRKDATLRNFKSGLIRIVYFEGEVRVGEGSEQKDKLFDDLALRFDVVLMLACILEGEFNRGGALVFGDDGVLRVC